MALADLVRKLGEALVGAVASPAGKEALTLAHLSPFAKLIGGLPIGDLVALIEGRGTVDSDLDLAERAAGLVAAAFPPGAITAKEIELALMALRALLDAAGLGSRPFKIAPGQNPIRGGWSGARGHV